MSASPLRPRIFVSSVIEGFAAIRMAARAGIESAGCEPVLVEDFPALNTSPRNACLDGVASCDGIVLIVGERGGWRAPSEKLVVEEEYDEAVRQKMPVLLFVQDVDKREDSAVDLLKRLESYIEGHFRVSFSSPNELQSIVARSLKEFRREGRSSMSAEAINQVLTIDIPQRETVLRTAVAPERDCDFESWISEHRVRDIARLARDSDLFPFDAAISHSVGADSTTLECIRPDSSRAKLDVVTVHSSGLVRVDSRLQNREENDRSAIERMVGHLCYFVAAEVIEERLASVMSFVGRLFSQSDPFTRYSSFLYNAIIHNLNEKLIERNPQPRQSIQIPTSSNAPLMASDSPRRIARRELQDFTEESRRAVERFVRIRRNEQNFTHSGW